MNIKRPFLMYVGNTSVLVEIKTAAGVIEWCPEDVVGVYTTGPDALTFGKPVINDFKAAVAAGANTFVVGSSPTSGMIDESWIQMFFNAMDAGLDIACGLHEKLNDISFLVDYARKEGVVMHDFRHRDDVYPKGTGMKRPGLRLLTVGTDCACGKKFTAISIARECKKRGLAADFRSTGQTGYLISSSGINNDTIPADFLSGAAEWLSPANAPDHWDVIEGQGALFHPAYAGGSLSLLMGSQPDLIVLCHDPAREKVRGPKGMDFKLMSLEEEIEGNLLMGRRTNPKIRLGAISINGRYAFPEGNTAAYLDYKEGLMERFGVPVFDPLVDGVSALVDVMARMSLKAGHTSPA